MTYKSSSSLKVKAIHATKQAVVPHRHNDYRPHLIRMSGIIVMILVVAAFQLTYNLVQTGSVLGQTTTIEAQELLRETNEVRKSNGESPLVYNAALNKAAELKARDMFQSQYWAHTSPSGVTPWTWFDRAGYQYQNAGENLAKDFHTARGVMTAWLDSTEHRSNILDTRYSEVGFAILPGTLDGKETTVVVAMYGSPEGQALGRQTSTAPAQGVLSPMARLGIGIQSMSPVALGSIFVLLVGMCIALISHGYRSKLPYAWQRSWRQHHGLYKAVGMASLIVIVIGLYGGGQI